MFAYCLNNPINCEDSLGLYTKYSDIHIGPALIPCPAPGGGATGVSQYGGTFGGTYTITETQEAAAQIAIAVTILATQAAEKKESKKHKTYSVYFLEDDTGTIRYVGRVNDNGYTARMAYHKRTRGLTPKYRISNLTFEQARGLEEIGMITFHTINVFDPQANKIRGVAMNNKKRGVYINAAKEYLSNHTENFLLNLTE